MTGAGLERTRRATRTSRTDDRMNTASRTTTPMDIPTSLPTRSGRKIVYVKKVEYEFDMTFELSWIGSGVLDLRVRWKKTKACVFACDYTSRNPYTQLVEKIIDQVLVGLAH